MATADANMSPRIEIAEVLSFRLKVPRRELEALPDTVAGGLNLTVAVEKSELVVSAVDAESYLRFRAIGAEAMLTEIALSKDERGAFFQRVLGPLMVRFLGDLHLKLTWNV